jgi:CheY-like chemotaxis protein
LVLSRKLANALGGDLVLLSSELAQGSAFRITADVGLAEAAPDAPWSGNRLDPTLLGDLNILLAEDSADSRKLIQRFLTSSGAHVDSVENGRQAVDTAMMSEYDLVIMDMQMPEIDGYTATRELRRRGFGKPIIALTAHAMREEREKSLLAGCDDHLTKPISNRQLVDAVRQIADGSR